MANRKKLWFFVLGSSLSGLCFWRFLTSVGCFLQFQSLSRDFMPSKTSFMWSSIRANEFCMVAVLRSKMFAASFTQFIRCCILRDSRFVRLRYVHGSRKSEVWNVEKISQIVSYLFCPRRMSMHKEFNLWLSSWSIRSRRTTPPIFFIDPSRG